MHYIIKFITLNKELPFDIEYTENTLNNSIVDEFINDVRITTYGTKEVKYDGFILLLDEFVRNRYNDLFAKYTKFNTFKKLHELENMIVKSSCTNYMAVIFNKQMTHIQHKMLIARINELENDIPAEAAIKEYINENGRLLSVYNPHAISPDTSTVGIGTKQKEKRVCRYCHKSMPNAQFKNKSHTISKALGNTCYINYDECDSCNSKFGLSIEQDFYHYVEMYNSLTHNNFKLGGISFSKDNNGNILVTNIDEELSPLETESGIIYKYEGSVIRLQNVYRAMCKYAIGFLPSELLVYLSDTINWINGDYDIHSLPIVKKAVHNSQLKQPLMDIYIRNESADQSYPYIFVDFHLNYLEFLFIIPNSQKDNVDYSDKSNYSKFWKLLTPFHERAWNDIDMSSMNKSNMKGKVTFHKRNKTSV